MYKTEENGSGGAKWTIIDATAVVIPVLFFITGPLAADFLMAEEVVVVVAMSELSSDEYPLCNIIEEINMYYFISLCAINIAFFLATKIYYTSLIYPRTHTNPTILAYSRQKKNELIE